MSIGDSRIAPASRARSQRFIWNLYSPRSFSYALLIRCVLACPLCRTGTPALHAHAVNCLHDHDDRYQTPIRKQRPGANSRHEGRAPKARDRTSRAISLSCRFCADFPRAIPCFGERLSRAGFLQSAIIDSTVGSGKHASSVQRMRHPWLLPSCSWNPR